MDEQGTEFSAHDLWQIWQQTYLSPSTPLKYVSHELTDSGCASESDTSDSQQLTVTMEVNQHAVTLAGCGNGPIDALLNALDLDIQVHGYEERSLSYGSDAQALTIVELTSVNGSLHGAGIHDNIVTSSLLAIASAINRGIPTTDDSLMLQRFKHSAV
ncbi:MAG: hypothetical protein F6K65_43995 [Moorea sp. SIO3C2]|nr:hypothetical protein [Moorena sp. SIO3C2]